MGMKEPSIIIQYKIEKLNGEHFLSFNKEGLDTPTRNKDSNKVCMERKKWRRMAKTMNWTEKQSISLTNIWSIINFQVLTERT